MTPNAFKSDNPLIFGVTEAHRRAMLGNAPALSSFGPPAEAQAQRFAETPAKRMAAVMAMRAATVGDAPDRVEERTYGDLPATAYAIKGGRCEGLASASAAMSRPPAPDLDAAPAAPRR